MKKLIKTLCTAALLTCFAAVPAFAAETKADFKTEAAPIRGELKSSSDELSTLREENKASAAAFKALRTQKKAGSDIGIPKEDWKKAVTLKKEIASIRQELKSTDGSVKSLRKTAQADVKSGSYDSALDHLKEAASIKEDRLDSVARINAIWDEIDELLR